MFEKFMDNESEITYCPRLLTIKKASVYSGLTIWTLREMIWNRIIPYIQVKRTYFIDREDLDKWIDNNKTYQM